MKIASLVFAAMLALTTPSYAAAPALSATLSSNQVILSWTDSTPNVSTYLVRRSPSPSGTFTTIATVSGANRSHTDGAVVGGTSYTYRVEGVVQAPSPSNTATVTVPAISPPSEQAITMSMVNLSSGFAYYTTQNFGTASDSSSAPTASALRLFENGVELRPAHATHSTIRSIGGGRFSHWKDSGGNVRLYFSSSDNTNPKTNGRSYTYAIGSGGSPVPPPPPSSSVIGPQAVASTPAANGTLFASPTGSGVKCVSSSPCTLATVIAKAIPGDVVFLRGGIYTITSSVYLSGTGNSTNPITFESYPGELAILDGSTLPNDGAIVGIRVTGSWNVLRLIEIRHMPRHGVFISGNHNVLDGLNIHHNRLSGVHIYSDYAAYPYGAQGSYNTVQHTRTNDNSDAGLSGGNYANGGNADGISISSGEGNKVLYCLAARNSDDGIDTWRSTNTHIAYSIAESNGLASGNGNGFKAGSGTQPPYSNDTVVTYSLSYKNRATGFDANGGTNVRFSYNTAWSNGTGEYVLGSITTIDHCIASPTISITSGSGSITLNSWQRSGTVAFISTDPASGNDFLRPTAGGGFEDIGAVH